MRPTNYLHAALLASALALPALAIAPMGGAVAQQSQTGDQKQSGDLSPGKQMQETGQQQQERAQDQMQETGQQQQERAQDQMQETGQQQEEKAAEATEQTQPDAAPTMEVAASELVGRRLSNAAEERLGKIERVIHMEGKHHVVVEHGGLLGVMATETLVPVERLIMSGDELMLPDVSEEQLETMPEYDGQQGEEVTGDQMVSIHLQ